MGKYFNESNPEMAKITDRSYAEMGESLTGGETESNFEAGEDLGKMPLEKSLGSIANMEAGTDIAMDTSLTRGSSFEAGEDVAAPISLGSIANMEAGTTVPCKKMEAGEDVCWGCGECEDRDFEAAEDIDEGVTDNAPYHNIAKYKMITSGVEESEGIDTQKS